VAATGELIECQATVNVRAWGWHRLAAPTACFLSLAGWLAAWLAGWLAAYPPTTLVTTDRLAVTAPTQIFAGLRARPLRLPAGMERTR
jgi:hypothetical protein